MITPSVEAAKEPYTLLAMAQPGEILIVQNGDKRVWMMSIYYTNHEIRAANAPGIALHNGWIVCDNTFQTWDELHRYVCAKATRSDFQSLDYADYDAAEIKLCISEIESCDSLDMLMVARDVLVNVLEKATVLACDEDSRLHLVETLDQVEQRIRCASYETEGN